MTAPTERVAEAIYLATGLPKKWSAMTDHDRSTYRRAAQAAIDALGLTEERRIGTPGKRDICPHVRLVSPWIEQQQ